MLPTGKALRTDEAHGLMQPHPACLEGIGSAFRVVGTRALATALQDALGPKQVRLP